MTPTIPFTLRKWPSHFFRTAKAIMNPADRLDTIRALETKRHHAMIGSDLTVLGKLCSDGLVYTHSNASSDTKEEYLKKVEAGYFKYLEISRPEESISFQGDTAVVSGRMIASLLVGGVPKQLDNRTLSIWHNAGGEWSLIAFQATPIPRPSGA